MTTGTRLRFVALSLFAVLTPGPRVSAQSVLDRTPNLAGGWVGTPGMAHFSFLHRFEHGPGPTHKVTNFPTFLFVYTPVPRLLLGMQFATNSDLVPAYPNEWEAFARWAAPSTGPLEAAFTGGWNQAARSVDGEFTARLRAGRLSLLGAVRGFSSGYGEGGRTAVAGGAVLPLTASVALAGDVATLLDREGREEIAWGAGLQLRIPYTPHTLSIQATNTNTATLQGASRGSSVTRYGFEFTVPITVSRWFGGGGGTAADRTGTDTVIVQMSDFASMPERITISPGTTVVWVNEGQVEHSSTADGSSWDSGLLAPGERWSHTFTGPGEYPYRCTPHPFMIGVVAVTGSER